MSDNHFDVIIIGGRPAGASLVIRLAGNNLNILLVDRATFPSLPAVPSSPIGHPGTMRLMDELGIADSEYIIPGSKVERYMLNFVNFFDVELPTSRIGADRNYCIGIDRNLFDRVLWEHASRVAGVTACDGFSVTKILKDENGAVTGITGKSNGGASQSFTGDLVIGADGRFSFAAREFGAKVVEEENTYTTASYHAEWENVDDYSEDFPNAISNYSVGKGFFFIVIPIAERKYIIGNYMRAQDAHFGKLSVEQAYEASLQRVPHLLNRLKNAQRVTEVVGVRPITNGYREAFGDNWALVGDAVHYKDPIDGQGIYDALVGAKLLAQSIIDWKHKGTSWAQAGASYQQGLMDETHMMFKQTVGRVKQMVFIEPPTIIIKTYLRYLLNDPDYQSQFLRYISREINPAEFKTEPSISPKILFKGIAGDIRRYFKGA